MEVISHYMSSPVTQDPDLILEHNIHRANSQMNIGRALDLTIRSNVFTETHELRIYIICFKVRKSKSPH